MKIRMELTFIVEVLVRNHYKIVHLLEFLALPLAPLCYVYLFEILFGYRHQNRRRINGCTRSIFSILYKMASCIVLSSDTTVYC